VGRVVKKYVDKDLHCLDLEIGVENGEKRVTTVASATVVLPVRA
jgi:hypothetical protein